jgi:hypothetical protein
MIFFKNRKILKSFDSADLVPVRMQEFEIRDGKIIILLPKFRLKIFNILFRKSGKLNYNIRLDDPGSITWEKIDGQKTIAEICEGIKISYAAMGKELDDVENRVSKFLRMLYERKIISFKQLL